MSKLAMRMHAINPKVYAYRFMAEPGRGRLGLVMERSNLGLKVVGVTPSAAAEKAGVKAGDLIVSINGKPTMPDKGMHRDKPLHRLKAGQTVTLTLENGKGTSRTLRVTAQQHQGPDWPQALAMHNIRRHDKDPVTVDIERVIIDARKQLRKLRRRHMRFFVDTPWWG